MLPFKYFTGWPAGLKYTDIAEHEKFQTPKPLKEPVRIVYGWMDEVVIVKPVRGQNYYREQRKLALEA